MKTFTLRMKFFPALITGVFVLLVVSVLNAQVVRPYTNVYSDNIRGGHTIIGNTITAIYSSGSGSTGTVNTSQMNDFSTSNYTYGRTSAYGNDNSNIQFTDVDGTNPPATLITTGDQWKYSNANSEPASWPDVSSLPGGPGASPLGYGPTATVGTTLTDRRTYYFTRTVNFNPATYSGFTFNLTLDDGAVVYVNGTEVGRINMGTGTPGYTTNASSNTEPEEVSGFIIGNNAPFVNGNNTIGVEVHTSADSEFGTDDLFFDLELIGNGINQTVNSSSANLQLPAGSNTVKLARLYWGGRINGGTGGTNNINLRTARIKFNTEGYQTITAASGAIDKSLINDSDSAYQAYFDVTAYINARQNGTYTMADIKAATGSTGGGGHFAGWALVIVYENMSLAYSSVRVYDGFLQVYDDGSVTSQTITLNGLNPPVSFALSADAYMTTVAWEGDANLAASLSNPQGDFIKVNGTAVSNAVNPLTNFWNGTISKNGAHLSGNKNPDFKNQMGIDIDEIEVGTGFGITPITTNINVEFGTEADQYFPSIFAFTMKTKPPLVQLDKIVKDTATGNAPWQIPNNLLNPNEILTYIITGRNFGSGNALNSVVTDTLPPSLTFRNGSLKVNAPTPGVVAGFKTETGGDDAALKSSFGGKDYIKFFIGSGATPVSGGILAPDESFSVQFQCIVPSTATTINFVSNTARITGTEQDGITPFVDDGTAIIGPPGIGLPVKMTAFTVQEQNGDAILRWTTVTETNNNYFEIERSTDGVNFTNMGIVNGNGNSTDINSYQYSDPINTLASIIYYRLKVIDYDHNGNYSKIIALRLNGLIVLKNLTVYPSPFTSNLKLQITSIKETSITIRINNVAGQLETNYSITVQPGENIVVLSDLGHLKPGIHLMEIISKSGKITQKIFKQ